MTWKRLRNDGKSTVLACDSLRARKNGLRINGWSHTRIAIWWFQKLFIKRIARQFSANLIQHCNRFTDETYADETYLIDDKNRYTENSPSQAIAAFWKTTACAHHPFYKELSWSLPSKAVRWIWKRSGFVEWVNQACPILWALKAERIILRSIHKTLEIFRWTNSLTRKLVQ